MIISLEHNAVTIPDGFVEHLKSITTQPYQPITCGYTHSYELKELPNFRLMEGVAVPPHSDGIAGYRPILVLHNPSNSYVMQGTSQSLSPQRKGALIILDIDSEHEVKSKDPNSRLGPWMGLAWGPGGQSCMKAQWDVGEVVERARVKFSRLANNYSKGEC